MELLHTRPEQTLGGKGSIGLPARVWVGACVQVRGPCKHRGHVRDQGRRSEETAWVGGRVQGSLAISEPSAPARAPLWMGQEDLRAGNRPQWRGRRPSTAGPLCCQPLDSSRLDQHSTRHQRIVGHAREGPPPPLQRQR